MTSSLRSKRARLSVDSQPVSGWNCPACTFLNPNSAFKCEICSQKKGTSTRIASTVDTGAIELQRCIQEQIDKQKKVGRRSDSAAGHSDTHGRQNHVKHGDDSNESWRLLGDSDSSSFSGASSVTSDHQTNRHSTRSPSPSPKSKLNKPSSSVSSNKTASAINNNNNNSSNNNNNNGSLTSKKKPPTKTAKSRDDNEVNVPSSSASSCSNSIASGRIVKNGKKPLNSSSLFSSSTKGWPRSLNADRQSTHETAVTVRGVTVVFIDHDPA